MRLGPESRGLRLLVLLLAYICCADCAAGNSTSNTDTDTGGTSDSGNDGSVTTSAQSDVPSWATASSLQLKLGTTPNKYLPQQYTVIPLTQDLGLNESSTARGIVDIVGMLTLTDVSNFNNVTGPQDIAYLSCDSNANSLITPSQELVALMSNHLRAIILYSTAETWCSLDYDGDLHYTSILSMVDPGEANTVYGLVNQTDGKEDIIATITGTANQTSNPDPSNNGGSSVAMSVLYSITGLITLLFIVIIATGAVRAHRYPERYGPRRGAGGQPRQSRARGMARAMLDTIPIVKFSNHTPTKPDPDLEMEPTAVGSPDLVGQREAGTLEEERKPEMTTAVDAASETAQDEVAQSHEETEVAEGGEENEEHLGCSICTEDFKVGEDVRVLPCNHQFHPQCVDPWLVNISGTCPLCRYDLRPPGSDDHTERPSEDSAELPPPLTLEGDEAISLPRPRSSQALDSRRLRQAPFEEQIQALRQLREEGHGAGSGDEAASEHHRQGTVRFAARLRDKFRIRTRAQPAES